MELNTAKSLDRNVTKFTAIPGDLLLNGFSVGLCKQIQHGTAKVVCVAVWITQLIGYRIQEQIATWEEEYRSQCELKHKSGEN